MSGGPEEVTLSPGCWHFIVLRTIQETRAHNTLHTWQLLSPSPSQARGPPGEECVLVSLGGVMCSGLTCEACLRGSFVVLLALPGSHYRRARSARRLRRAPVKARTEAAAAAAAGCRRKGHARTASARPLQNKHHTHAPAPHIQIKSTGQLNAKKSRHCHHYPV